MGPSVSEAPSVTGVGGWGKALAERARFARPFGQRNTQAGAAERERGRTSPDEQHLAGRASGASPAGVVRAKQRSRQSCHWITPRGRPVMQPPEMADPTATTATGRGRGRASRRGGSGAGRGRGRGRGRPANEPLPPVGDSSWQHNHYFSITCVKLGTDVPEAWLEQCRTFATSCASSWFAFALERGAHQASSSSHTVSPAPSEDQPSASHDL